MQCTQTAPVQSVPFTGPPDRFIPSEEDALALYRRASIHSFTDADYGFAKAVSCLRLISVFKVYMTLYVHIQM